MLCADCRASLAWVDYPLCMACGRQAKSSVQRCRLCEERPLPLKQVRAAVHYVEPVPRIIHKLKYEDEFALATVLADWMHEAWAKWAVAVDVLVPIPLHKERYKSRGYNQAELIAKKLAPSIQVPLATKALKRQRDTQSQVGLKASARQTNVQDAFQADRQKVQGRSILLIDDVYTTGATLRAAALSLIQAGARDIYGYCVAQADK